MSPKGWPFDMTAFIQDSTEKTLKVGMQGKQNKVGRGIFSPLVAGDRSVSIKFWVWSDRIPLNFQSVHEMNSEQQATAAVQKPAAQPAAQQPAKAAQPAQPASQPQKPGPAQPAQPAAQRQQPAAPAKPAPAQAPAQQQPKTQPQVKQLEFKGKMKI